MKPVLLIFPGEKRRQPLIPLSVITLAAYLQKCRIQVEVLDTRISDYTKVDFGRYLFVGLSVTGGEAVKSAYEISNHIKQKYYNTIIVWGGTFSSSFPKKVCWSELVDIVVRKEGEKTLLELARCLSKRKSIKGIRGITFKGAGKIVSNPDRQFINMNKLPLPAYEFLDLSKYANGTDYVGVETSRGCPHKCIFCSTPALGNHRWRAKSSKRLADEIGYLTQKFSMFSFYFWDNNVFVDKKRVINFCRNIIKSQKKISWSAYGRADDLARYSDEEIVLMKLAGLSLLSVGAESGSQHVLDSLRKDIKISDIETVVLKCAKHKIPLALSFILGTPYETFGDIQKTIELCKHLKKIYPALLIKFHTFEPFLGIQLGKKRNAKITRLERLNPMQDCSVPNGANARIKTIYRITSFLYMREILKRRGDEFQKKVLGSTAKVFLWKIASPLIYADALLRWKLLFFDAGYEWDLPMRVAKKPLLGLMGEFNDG